MYINVLELLEENVRDNPEQIALRDSKSEITYRELCDRAKTIATHIGNAIGIGTQRRAIAVCIDRDIESVILFMAVLYSGNFYVPIDTNMPIERIKMIFDVLNPCLVLSSRGQKMEGYETVDIDDACIKDINEKYIDTIRRGMIDTDPMYAIFTSGSTGRPKGVLVSHRSVIDLVEQFAVSFDFSESPVFGNQAPFDFDVSVKDIYNSFYQHGTVCIIPKQCFSMPAKLIEFLVSNEIDTIIWAVSAMRIVENFKVFSHLVPEKLKLIMFSGEIMPVKVLNYWKENIPNATYVNLYGPTEITCNCTYYVVDRDYASDEALPIGIPFRNTQIILLDVEKDNPIYEANKLGEICVRGTCLALGYFGAPEITTKSFCQNPLVDAYPERIYRTGDLGFFDEKNILHFSSRKDYQIKHMGHRIELGEIEVAVNSIEYIDAAVCVYDTDNEKIVLFYQLNKSVSPYDTSKEVEKDIVRHLSKKLQKYMWPNVYISYDVLPLNKNGKIDRVLLAKCLKEA